MDRQIVYPSQIPLETDILSTNKDAMIGLAKLAEVVLGRVPVLIGLPCTPGTGLTVSVGAGQVYNLADIDATAYSSLAADTVHTVLKQGLLLDPVTLNCPAPGTVGQSINYLVEVAYQDIDTGAVVLPYYNSSNPAVPYSGPGNTGATNYTIRSGACTVQVKAGTAAATGTQTTPAVDAGFIDAYVVTVAYGAVSIVSGNISTVTGAPFLSMTLPTVPPFRLPVPFLIGYGAAAMVPGTVGDTPVSEFWKTAAQSASWSFPITAQIDITKPVKFRIHYTTDVGGGNFYLQLGYQVFNAGALSPASYTNVSEAMAAPATAGNVAEYLTAVAVIPSAALVSLGWINCVLTRESLNALDTNTGKLQIINITMEQ